MFLTQWFRTSTGTQAILTDGFRDFMQSARKLMVTAFWDRKRSADGGIRAKNGPQKGSAKH